MIDPAGSFPLHIGMPSNRARSRAFPAKVAAHQQHIDNLPNGVHCVRLLGDPKAPSDDGRSRLAINFTKDADLA
jgi:hypothetical protein